MGFFSRGYQGEACKKVKIDVGGSWQEFQVRFWPQPSMVGKGRVEMVLVDGDRVRVVFADEGGGDLVYNRLPFIAEVRDE